MAWVAGGGGGDICPSESELKKPSFCIFIEEEACRYSTIVCHCCCISNPSFCVIFSPFQLSLVRILP